MRRAKHKAIALWSGPRNVSTALMYSIANRGDVRVIDEPLFAHFLRTTDVWRPSRDEALAAMESDPKVVLTDMMDHQGFEFVFSKNMANHLEGLEDILLKEFVNIILTRAPSAVIQSYRKHIDQPSMLDLCYEHQLRIIRYLRENGEPCLVVDSDELRNNPEQQLKRLCNYLNIPFTGRMLQWEPGPRPEDGVWAKYWYHHVHLSTGFVAASLIDPPEGEQLTDLWSRCKLYYEEIISDRHE